MANTDVVKSSFMVDPNDNSNLIRRTESGVDLDREYWERVNQGENVSNVAKMWEETQQTSEQNQREQRVSVGKLKRDSFLENFAKNDENINYKDQIKTGKLNVDELYPMNTNDENFKPEIRVGKLNTKDIFSNKENEDVALVKPKMRIGKLDPKHMFESSNKERENEKEMFNAIVIGKLNPKNLFENNEKEETEKPTIQVGKIKAKELFSETNETSISKSNITVGKLKIKEEDLFENKDENDKPVLPIGKINTSELFNNSPTDEKAEVKFYKPTVQPKKIKVQNLFQESGEHQQSQRQEIKVGKINATAFLQNASDCVETPKQSLRVGKLDTTKLFVPVEPEEVEEDNSKSVVVGKINLGQVFHQSAENEEDQKKEMRVGKLKQNIYNLNDSGIETDESPEEVPKLRGARRVNKGNRISCLIENLHTDKKNDSDEEKDDDDKEVEEVEEIKLGRDRMSAIQNMFSGQESQNDSPQGKKRVSVTSPQMAGIKEKFFSKPEKSISSTNFNEFEELKDEGLVSSNLERFASGKILGTQTVVRKSSLETNYIDKKHIESVSARFEETASKSNQAQQNTTNHVPRKLKNTENMFQHTKEDYTDCVRVEVKVGKIDAENIYKPNSEETELAKCSTVKVGKLKNTDSMFNNQTNEDSDVIREVRVGKIDADNIYKPTEEENYEDKKSQLRVGKLSKDVFNPPSEQSPEPRTDIKVGKISTKDLFQKAEENSEELLSIVKVGKLSEDKLYLASNAGDDQVNKKDIDTDIVPAGNVSERANAFLTSTKTEASPAKAPCPKVKRSESSAAADMQKKYQDQMQSGSLKRNKSQKIIDKTEKPQVVVESGKIKEARNSFFQSMMTCSSGQSSSAQRLGTSIMPAGASNDWKIQEASSESTSNEVRTTSSVSTSNEARTTSSKKGKALFQRCAERQEEEEITSMVDTKQLLPGVDLEEIEDEFERLHREMMGDSD
eukprot:GFUD01009191.1.p1 GENE.GFUD01009191.1~~GFUD01009191.1.p1  ORF type:complete len:962 (+),score=281.01 GFUD01009191.1:210-3095(+)